MLSHTRREETAEVTSTQSQPRRQMVVTGERHAPTALYIQMKWAL